MTTHTSVFTYLLVMDLLERKNDLAKLSLLWANATAGWGKTVLITGEAGVGRTSFLQQFSQEIKNTGAYYVGCCEPLFSPRPLGPLYDIAPRLGKTFTQSIRNQENHSVIFASLLEELSRSAKPICLVIEDAQWADAGTLDLIQYLGRRIEALPILFVLSYRTCELAADHPLKAALGSLLREHTDRIDLLPLSRECVAGLAHKHSVRTDLLYELTQGNPFYLTEVLNTSSDTLPETVTRFIASKLAALSPAARQLCELVSTIPNEAELSVISQITFGCESKLKGDDPELVERCTNSGLIDFTGTGLRFRHEIARRAVENSLSVLKRKSWHGVMLEIMIRDQTLPKARLVHHAAQAGLGALVLELAPQAAQEASLAGAHREACHHFATAIPFAKHSPLQVQAMLYEGWAYHGLMSTSMDSRFVEALKRAITLWKEIGNVERVGYNLRMLSVLNWSLGRIEDSFACVTEAIALLEKIPPSHALAMAYSMRSQNFVATSNLDQAIIWGEKALKVATKLEATEAIVHALCNLGTALMRSHCVEGETMIKRSIAIGQARGFHEPTGVAYINYCESLLWQFRLAEAELVCNEGLDFVKRTGAWALSFSLMGLLAQIAARLNRFGESQTLAQKVLENTSLSPLVRWPALAATAMCLTRIGHPDGFAKLDELVALSRKLSLPHHQLHASIMQVETFWIAGDLVRAKRALASALELRGDESSPWLIGQLSIWWHRLNTRLDPSGLPVDVAIAAPFALEISGDVMGAASWWSERAFTFEQAICLMHAGDDGLVAAAQLLTQIEATPAVHRLRQLARKLKIQGVKRGHYGSAASNSFHLTAREIAILQFVAKGLSDGEIAEKVARSKRTIQNHVGSLLSKVGVKNRLTLVSVVQRSGLLKLDEAAA
jgi:DNA-binding CsgD family transcriptional regulator/tetratricopeptide (TPR) repeat protein